MKEWLRSEAACVEEARRAMTWVKQFHASDTKTFRVAYAAADKPSMREDPNAATSLVCLVVTHCRRLSVIGPEFEEWHSLNEVAAAIPAALAGFPSEKLLPLRTFGVLPLFSTSYLAELLCDLAEPRALVPFVIAVRRILFELYERVTNHKEHLRKVDHMHPYLLYRCMRSLDRWRGALFRDPACAAAVAFRQWITDDAAFRAQLAVDKTLGDFKTGIEAACGAGNTEFHRSVLAELFTGSGDEGSTLLRLRAAIEDEALNDALSEIAKHKSAGRQADPSILAFSLAILARCTTSTHAATLGQGVRVLVECCANGMFQSSSPFYIDDKGRALFVPSVEIANLALRLVAERDGTWDSELETMLDATRHVQDRLIDDQNTIELDAPATDPWRKGWCSDRAPSSRRIDSWITVQAMEFFLRRLELLRLAKRRHILSQYSWIPHTRCAPSLDEITDPGEGLAATTTKAAIKQVIEARERERAPMFLLYGPPGTSKTTFIAGVAATMNWDLVTLSPSDFVADSLDRIEQRSRAIFNDLMNLDRCVILLDEMDSLLRDRATLSKGTIMEFVVPALLPKIQQLRDYVLHRRMAVFFVTNYYETIDSAISRGGRIDNHLLVLPYGKQARLKVAQDFVKRLHKKRLAIVGSTGVPSETGVLDLVTQALEDLPCNLVYRDVEQLVRDALSRGATLPKKEDLVAKGRMLGVRPEVYLQGGPRGGTLFREVCAFLERLANQPTDRDFSGVSKEDASRFFNEVRAHLPKWQEWNDFAHKWTAP